MNQHYYFHLNTTLKAYPTVIKHSSRVEEMPLYLPLWWTGFGQAVSLLLQPLSGPPQCNCLPWNPLSCLHSQVTLSATSQRKKAPQFSTCTQVTGSREKDHSKAARIQKDRGTEHAAVSAQHLCREPFAPQFCLVSS